MIELATCLSILKEETIMAMDSSTADHLVSPAQVWRQLRLIYKSTLFGS